MVRKCSKDNFDLDIKYHALVDFQAFCNSYWYPSWRSDYRCSIFNSECHLWQKPQLRRAHATETESPPKPSKLKTADEWFYLLNYTASVMMMKRWRTKRQQQVMSAVLEQIKDPTKSSLQDLEALESSLRWLRPPLPYSLVDQWFICHRRRSEWYRKVNCPRTSDCRWLRCLWRARAPCRPK